ncbi:MAG: hypothetical protein PWQ28_344 [Candidatus Woesearchaeota archaeon]|nr:hypothetical protein [Candidatus Woesearchaeota archaeon]
MNSLEYNFEYLFLKGILLPHQSFPGVYRKGIMIKNIEKDEELYLAFINNENYDLFGSDGSYFGIVNISEMAMNHYELFNLVDKIRDYLEKSPVAPEMKQINLKMREGDDFFAESKLEELIN